MRRAERRRAEREGQTPRTVREIDYLLMVDDDARQGALRFAEREGGPFAAWRREAKKLGLTPAEIDRMASAFEHEDLKAALALVSRPQSSKRR